MGFIPMASLLGCIALMFYARKKAEAAVKLLDQTELGQVAAVLSQTRRSVFAPSLALLVMGIGAYFLLDVSAESVALTALLLVFGLTSFANYRTRVQLAGLDLPEMYLHSLFQRHMLEMAAMALLIGAIGATALGLL